MKFFRCALLIASIAIFGACSVFQPVTFNSGTTESDVVAKLGQPTNRYQDGSGHLLEYAKGPWGQQTYMARFDADGKLVSYEQVLTTQKFSTIKIGDATKADVLRTIGAPSETSYLTLSDLEVWSYPYKESDVWDSMMHVHFDRAGIVQKMLNGPDPRFDPDNRFPFGRIR
ncbi:outer membrane protein assembly factor BamE [Noviherbaspirillum cavernae]|uniref:Outer membrane protein assembly factor BamE n=1 Tax=Noviherbaspirillum cavernae TaxID=2320862 RepID=A0A418X1R1_9BURK|nr:outer membrane protein assembly factor BamE [Noviherbaspirillum cavernae]RJG06378.1 outer membrane protein assembly factor BamE [Noviherbaspirillum cavernae]